jgi:hypothetical protein
MSLSAQHDEEVLVMQRQRFEYSTSYFPLAYEAVREGMLFFKGPPMPTNPLTADFVQSSQYQDHMQTMGTEGWELVGVQPALRATVLSPKKSEGQILSYPTTSGYFFFWKRMILARGEH